jgi:hypothetical protein
MQREVWDTQNCKECGAVKAALICEEGIDDQGDRLKAVWWDRIPHGPGACEKYKALQREQWPVLFEMEANNGA